jgi:hypothetical protein
MLVGQSNEKFNKQVGNSYRWGSFLVCLLFSISVLFLWSFIYLRLFSSSSAHIHFKSNHIPF